MGVIELMGMVIFVVGVAELTSTGNVASMGCALNEMLVEGSGGSVQSSWVGILKLSSSTSTSILVVHFDLHQHVLFIILPR